MLLSSPSLQLSKEGLSVTVSMPIVLDLNAVLNELCGHRSNQTHGHSPMGTISPPTSVTKSLRWELGVGSHTVDMGLDADLHFTVPVKIDLAEIHNIIFPAMKFESASSGLSNMAPASAEKKIVRKITNKRIAKNDQ